jgi:hypothetical protein
MSAGNAGTVRPNDVGASDFTAAPTVVGTERKVTMTALASRRLTPRPATRFVRMVSHRADPCVADSVSPPRFTSVIWREPWRAVSMAV